MAPPASAASAAPSSPTPVHKHVQLVSKADSDQLLFKFPDLSDVYGDDDGDDTAGAAHHNTKNQMMTADHASASGAHQNLKPKRMSVDFPLASCFNAHASSYKMLEMGSVGSLLRTPPGASTVAAGNSSPSFSMDASSTPLITPRSRSRRISSSSTPLSARSKFTFKRYGHHHSKTGKVTQKLVKGASKCIRNKYRSRIQMASRRYRLRNSLGPHVQLNGV